MTDLAERLDGDDAENVRAEVLARLNASEKMWRQRMTGHHLSPTEFSKARAYCDAYQAALAIVDRSASQL